MSMDSKAIINGVARAVSEVDAKVTRKVEDMQARIDEVHNQVKRDVRRDIANVMARDWSAELIKDYRLGFQYKAGDLVRHNGGVFQAFTDTDAAPGSDRCGWVCVINGVADTRFEMSGPHRKHIAVMTDGRAVSHEWRETFPIHKGKWAEGDVYAEGEEVAWDGCTWRAKTATGEQPGQSGDWLLVAQRGAAGKRGDLGPRGEKGDQGGRGDKGEPGRDADPADAAMIVLRGINEALRVRLAVIS
jgi:hypothetical protein